MRYFKEIQTVPVWFYILIFTILLSLIAFLAGLYFNLENQIEKRELLVGIAIAVIVEIPVLLLLFFLKQEVTIDKKNITYRYPPYKNKPVHIPISKIKHYDCINYPNMHYGYKVGVFALFIKTPMISMIGVRKAIKLIFNDGKEFIIGTRKPVEFLEILNRIKRNDHEFS